MSPPTQRSAPPGGSGEAPGASRPGDDHRKGTTPQRRVLAGEQLQLSPDPRSVGVRQALDGASLIGLVAGEEAIRKLARTGRPFTAEDVRALVGGPLGCRPPVLGALFLAAAKRGEIEPCGFRQATRPEARRRVLRVWRGAP